MDEGVEGRTEVHGGEGGDEVNWAQARDGGQSWGLGELVRVVGMQNAWIPRRDADTLSSLGMIPPPQPATPRTTPRGP